MAIDGFSTTAFYSEAVAPVTAAPLTLACWFRSTSATANQNLITIQVNNNNNYFGMSAAGNVAGDPVRAYINGAGAGLATADTSTGYSINTWHHACAVFESNTSRSAYKDGGSKVSNTTDRTPTGLNKHYVGVYNATGAGDPMVGAIAEVAIWNAALTDSEVASLAKGFSPRLIRPQSLVRYRPFIREVICIKSGAALTTTGTPTVFNHPRVYA